MEKVWDNSLSTLVNSNPQAFLDLMLPGARCLDHHRTKLSGTQRQPDAVLEAERYGETFIFNPEFQSSQDTGMAERLLLYHMLLCSQHKPLPVRSCVLALLKRAKVDSSPLLWTQPGEPPGRKKERIRFSYEIIELWKIDHKVLLDLGHVELYPLLPLTKGGTTRKIVAVMFDHLPAEDHREFALIGFTFSSIMFRQLKRYNDLEWLERKFRHMHDIIRESPVYEWILAEGREEEKAQGLAQMRQTVVEIVQERFPALAQLAEEVVATMNELAQLRRLAVKLSSAQSPEQAHKILLDLAQ